MEILSTKPERLSGQRGGLRGLLDLRGHELVAPRFIDLVSLRDEPVAIGKTCRP